MAKRKHEIFSSGDPADLARSKRRSSGSSDEAEAEALKVLQSHADELAVCLKSPEASSRHNIRTLASLSRKLLPAIQYLSDNIDMFPEPNVLGSAEEAQAAPPSTQLAAGYIPPLGILKAWTVADIPKILPPLPSIPDPDLETAALTHPGMLGGSSELNYELLEFLGDAFIYHAASELISQTFPKHTPGKCSHIRELLLRNVTLAKYSEHYGLDRRAVFPEELFGSGRVGGTKASQQKQVKTLGDIFEAYVGALIHSSPEGIVKAVAWLKPLWAMTIADEIRRADRQNASLASRPEIAVSNGQEKSYKQQLAIMISVPGVKITYKEMPNKQKNRNNLPLFGMTVHVEAWGAPEQFLAKGSGVSKKEAGEKAAEMALENKRALKELVAKKQEHLARKAALSI